MVCQEMTSGPCNWTLPNKMLNSNSCTLSSTCSTQMLYIKKHGFGKWLTIYLCHDRTAAFHPLSEFLPASHSAKSNNIYHSRNMSFIHETVYKGRFTGLTTSSTLTDGLSCRGRGHVERRTGLALKDWLLSVFTKELFKYSSGHFICLPNRAL